MTVELISSIPLRGRSICVMSKLSSNWQELVILADNLKLWYVERKYGSMFSFSHIELAPKHRTGIIHTWYFSRSFRSKPISGLIRARLSKLFVLEKSLTPLKMGKAIKKFGWKRNDVVITTKVFPTCQAWEQLSDKYNSWTTVEPMEKSWWTITAFQESIL